MLRLLYLDIDGVLNRHDQHANGFSTMHPECLAPLNQLLADMPDVQLVLSSAWRYQVHNGNMTMAGLEILLQTHGLNCYQRLHSVTRSDEDAADGQYDGSRTQPEWWEWLKRNGHRVRSEQIRDHFAKHMGRIASFAVVDDMQLVCPRFVKTDSTQGLTHAHADQLRNLLANDIKAHEVHEPCWWKGVGTGVE